jgi:hypothetical protein
MEKMLVWRPRRSRIEARAIKGTVCLRFFTVATGGWLVG